jgi:hypothetical protein
MAAPEARAVEEVDDERPSDAAAPVSGVDGDVVDHELAGDDVGARESDEIRGLVRHDVPGARIALDLVAKVILGPRGRKRRALDGEDAREIRDRHRRDP